MDLTEKWSVSLGRLMDLEWKEKDLERARRLIKRLRARLSVLEDERRSQKELMEGILQAPSVRGNYAKMYGAVLLRTRLRKARQL